jgi:O-antigen/teichoic acid export membrane protein
MTTTLTSESETSRPHSVWRLVGRSAGTRMLVLPVSAILGIINTRLIIEHFGSSTYAEYGLLVGIGLLFPFADLGMSAALINAVGSSADPRSDRNVVRVLTTALRVLCGSAGVLLLVSGVISVTGVWSTILGSGLLPGSGAVTAGLCLSLIALTMPVGFGDRILTGLGKNQISIIVQGMQTPLVMVALLLVIHLTTSKGAYIAALPYLATFMLALVSCRFASRLIKPVVGQALRDAPKVKTVRGGKVSDVAWPMLIQMIALPIAMQTDRLILSHVSGSHVLAQYNLASQMFTPIWQVVNSAGVVLWPIFARQRALGGARRVSPMPISLAFGGAAAAVGLVIALSSGWLSHVAAGGVIHLPLNLVIAFMVLMIFQATKYPLGMFMTHPKGLRYQALMIVLLLPVNLGLSLYLAKVYGAAGPVIGSAVGVFFCQVLANWLYVRRELSQPPSSPDDPDGPGRGSRLREAAVRYGIVRVDVRGDAVTDGARLALRRRVAVFVSGGCGLAVLIGIVWILITGLMARSQLNEVKSELAGLRAALVAGDFDKAHRISTELASHAHSAHELTSGPAWWAAASVPILGSPVHTSRVIAEQTDRVGDDVLPGVLQLADTVGSSSLRDGASINLAPIEAAAPVLKASASAAASAASAVHATSGSWLPLVSSAHNSVVASLDNLSGELGGASRAVQTLLPMLGESGQRRYFIGFENESESRGVGGLPGAFAIVTADHGKVTFTHFENDTELVKVKTSLDFGPEYDARYAVDDPTSTYTNSDISPNFPYAAQIWAAMWQQKSGEHVDGAIAIDPTALSYLLKVTGPAIMPSGEAVSANNVVALTEQVQYSRFNNDDQRKAYLVAVAKAVSEKVSTGGGSTTQLVRAVAKAAGQRRIVVWTADPAVEANLVQSGYAGVVKGGSGPYSGFVVVNATGGKLDYYLNRSMSYVRNGCGANGTAVASFTLTNDAPTSGLPPYVTIRNDVAPPGAEPGDNRLLVTYYATTGSTIRSVTVNGKLVTLASSHENGLVTITLDLELPVQSSAVMVVTVNEPAANKPVEILNQPLARAMRVTVGGDVCH